MRAYWATGRKGALQETAQPTPIDDGRFCRVIDLENGEIPVPTYGRSPQEVLDKIERTGMHARVRLTSSPAPRPQAPGGVPAPAPPRGRNLALTADEQMLATSQLSDPQLAPRAITKLFEAATGLDTQELAARACQERAMAWEATHPELRDNAFNKRIIMNDALLKAGGNLANVTAAILEKSFQELQAGGYLLTEEELPESHNPPALPVPPDENPAARTRETQPAFASSHRLNRTGISQPPQWKPKYTRDEINRMPLAQSERLWRTQDKDWIEANEHWYPSRQARA